MNDTGKCIIRLVNARQSAKSPEQASELRTIRETFSNHIEALARFQSYQTEQAPRVEISEDGDDVLASFLFDDLEKMGQFAKITEAA